MLLLSGPPGSGKTHLVLQQVRDALRRGATGFRVLVPTLTMAEHLRNVLAREGFAFRPGLIQTLSRFVNEWLPDTPELTSVTLDLVIEKVLQRACPPEFSGVAARPGFRRLIARLIDELSSAGHDSRRLIKLLGEKPADAPLAPAFLRLWEDVEKELCLLTGLMRALRLRRAGDEIRSRGLGPIERVYVDGFFTFSHPELYLLHAIRSQADLTIALPIWHGAEAARTALRAMGLEERTLASALHRFPIQRIVKAATIEQEAAEIARRILDHVANGREFREIGILLRGRDPYVPILRAALERFGIPARFYFQSKLADAAAVRYILGAIEAMLSGWEHQRLLPLLKMAVSGFGATNGADRFDFEVRRRLPGRGLAGLRKMSDHPRLGALLDRLGGMEPWPAGRSLAVDWAFRVKNLRCLIQSPGVIDGMAHEAASVWRGEARALELFAAAVDEAAAALPPKQPVNFEEFWHVLTAVLDRAELRVADNRRNVVHVMDVEEARQWELPVVLVCGLIERQFPRYHNGEPVFPDAARMRLQASGVRLRTIADLQAEEEFLFEIAATRATSELVLTYPEHNEKGDPNLPSFFLEGCGVAPEPAKAAAPRAPEPAGTGARDPYIQDFGLLETIAARHEAIKPSAVEAFLQCPFRFFLEHTLELETPPPLPRDRLDPRVEGAIVHQALAGWRRDGESLDDVFARVFDAITERERVPEGCRRELARIRMLRDLRRFAADGRRLDGWNITTEREVQFELDEGVLIHGRIDRCDQHPDGRAVVFDYKYSRAEAIRKRLRGYDEGRCVQGALYLLGLERTEGVTPAGLFYCGLRKEVMLDGWHLELPGFERTGTSCTAAALREKLDAARATTIAAAEQIRRGRVEAWPSNREACDCCDYLDVCRVGPPAEAVAEGAGE